MSLVEKNKAELERYGMFICRGFLNNSQLSDIYRMVEAAYSAADAGHASERVTNHVKAFGGLNLMWMHESGVPLPEVERLTKIVADAASAQIGLCKVVPEISLFRRHTEPRTHIPWHADADGASTMHYDPCFNFWLPFVAVGVDRPSLEYVPSSHAIMRKLPPLDASYALREDSWVRENLPEKPQVAILEPGDVLVFDHYTLHRTQPMASQAGPRISGEFRVQISPR